MRAKAARYAGNGERHWNASGLTEDDVRAIRASKEGQRPLAIRYGVHRSTIQHIRAGRNWKHVK